MNTPQDDGGPAFPMHGQPEDRFAGYLGMSLRDWFAGNQRIEVDEGFSWQLCQALAGPQPYKDEAADPIGWLVWRATWQAKIRFIRADAMLAARKEQP